jgi:hypothetical protein
MQLAALAHDTLVSVLAEPSSLALEVTDQEDPFQDAVRVWSTDPLSKMPVAAQLAALGHDTASRRFCSELAPGSGLVMVDQEVPFQDSARVWSSPEPFTSLPTAMQLLALAHEMPLRMASEPVVGVVVTDHDVPFQDSAKVTSVDPLERAPAARQLVVLAHDTASRILSELPVLGLARTDHVLPFQDSARVRSVVPL